MAEEEKVVVVAEVEKKVKETPDVVEVKEEAQVKEPLKELET